MPKSPELARRLGVIITSSSVLRAGRSEDPVGTVALQTTLVDLPRGPGAKSIGALIRNTHPGVDILPYAWHLVSHGVEEGLRQRSTRTLKGEAQRFGELQDTREVGQAWDATRACATALGARRIILRTPPSVTPGPLGRARLESFVTRCREDGFDLVWEPEGLWETDAAADLAESLSLPWITPAIVGRRVIDAWPLRAWLRVDGTGSKGDLDERHALGLVDLWDAHDGVDNAILLFGGFRAYANLRRVVDVIG